MEITKEEVTREILLTILKEQDGIKKLNTMLILLDNKKTGRIE